VIERILIIGATSAIAHAVARRYASRGARLFLLARRPDAMQANAADLRVRGAAEVRAALLDVDDLERHANLLDEAFAAFGGFDAALVAHGTLPDQAECEASVQAALASFDTNARSAIALLTDLANRFQAQGKGVIGVISSPAGDRGRASNYVYGAAKAALSNFASGLRHRLFSKGVRVITIEPGFVDTPMTTDFEKGPLWVSPEHVAADIARALQRGFGVVYTPWFWRWIMLLIRHLPERLFVRTRL
jgi:decaprenylphospho-beta-D-erythro-pentofuranosid-2-ulose 2-reductase